MTKIRAAWKRYKYRFVPWLAVNFRNRHVRAVPKGSPDKALTDDEVENLLISFFTRLENSRESLVKKRYENSQKQFDKVSKKIFQKWHSVFANYLGLKKYEDKCNHNDTGYHVSASIDHDLEARERNLDIFESTFGFRVECAPSVIEGGGQGVTVTRGCVPKGAIVGMYPGTVYQPSDPIFFQSIGNPFIFRCIDGVYIDGSRSGLSKKIYMSCSQRDRLGPYFTSDISWITDWPTNPLAVGQIVNNQSKAYPANVVYQEFDIQPNNAFPFHLQKYIPNIHYKPSVQDGIPVHRPLKMVVLVALRDIQCGEELFSSYFTVVY